MKIRSLTMTELTSHEWLQIMRLRSEVFVVEQHCIYLDPDDQDEEARHFIAEERGQIIGYARVIEAKNWHIGRIVTTTAARGKGIGKALVVQAKAWCKDQNPSLAIEMSSQVYLSEFYRNLGFEVIGRMYLEDGIPHVRMMSTVSE